MYIHPNEAATKWPILVPRQNSTDDNDNNDNNDRGGGIGGQTTTIAVCEKPQHTDLPH
jgi:hypothetical protein